MASEWGLFSSLAAQFPESLNLLAKTFTRTTGTLTRTLVRRYPKNLARRCSFLAASPCTHTGSGDRTSFPYKKNLHTRRVCVLFPPPKDACPPGQSSFSRIVFLPRTRAAGGITLCDTPAALTVRHEIENHVSAFVAASCPAPPVSTQTDSSLPCKESAGLPASPTGTTLISVEHFKSLRTSQAANYQFARSTPYPISDSRWFDK
jgi:hypothetical protein